MANARRLEQDTTRVDEERLQSQKRVLAQSETAYRQTIDKLIAEERRHLEAARQIDEQIASYRMSVDDRLARLAEKGQDPLDVYAMRQERIAEEAAMAREALRHGEYQQARAHAEKMASLAEQSADAVMDGDRVIISQQEAVARAYDQVVIASNITEKAYEKEQRAHIQSAEVFHQKAQSMTGEMEKVRAAMAELDQAIARDHKIILDADATKVAEAAKVIDDLLDKKERVIKIKAELQD
ncbi:MAG: hypothetical protein G8345_18790, partial [Magnetococcales bacterium]|nr:hypothetical protein [Magnetococcales bacterium]